MYLRISLIVVLLASAGTIALTEFAFRPKIKRLIQQREQLAGERNEEAARADQLASQVAETSQKLARSETTLQTTIQQLTNAVAENDLLRSRNNLLATDLRQANSDLNTARQQLAQLNALGLRPEQVVGLLKSNQVLTARLASLQIEKDKVAHDYENLKRSWDAVFVPPAPPPELPPVNGKVLAVDPKWEFVILNVGANDGLVPRGVLMISRGSKLIGKATLTRVESDRSIADLLPGWNVQDVREGDNAVN